MESPRPRTHHYNPPSYGAAGQGLTQSVGGYTVGAHSIAPPSVASPGRPFSASTHAHPSSPWTMTHGPAGHTTGVLSQQHYDSLGRGSPIPARSPGPPLTQATGPVPFGQLTAPSGSGGAPSAVIASLRETFLAATAPQRPAQHVAPYSLPNTAEEAGSWTSKYLRGNEQLRGTINTLLELAFVAPHSSLHGGKSYLGITVACTHGRESSLVGSREDQMRNKLLEVRVRGSMGWTFELTLRPSSDAVLWDKYGGIAAAVQDHWFVLGAILRDQFGVVLEEDAAGRHPCAACRRTNLALSLNKIY